MKFSTNSSNPAAVSSRKKSQAALEYLVTYGWAILAIVIIAAVLWYLGFFNPAQYSNPAGKECGGFSTVTCVDYTAKPPSSVTIVFGNAAGAGMRNVYANIDGTGLFCAGIVDQDGQFTCSISNLTFQSRDQLNVTISYVSAMSDLPHAETGFVRAE